MSAPLEGLRVIDFTRDLSGHTCTKAQRDLAADVTKNEPPAGDVGRPAAWSRGSLGDRAGRP